MSIIRYNVYILYVCLQYIMWHKNVLMASSYWWWIPDLISFTVETLASYSNKRYWAGYWILALYKCFIIILTTAFPVFVVMWDSRSRLISPVCLRTWRTCHTIKERVTVKERVTRLKNVSHDWPTFNMFKS